MNLKSTQKHSFVGFHVGNSKTYNELRCRLRQWQQARTWARLIREAESLWRVDVRELKHVGAIELSQLISEVPPTLRGRVNRWLGKYSVATRFEKKSTRQNKKFSSKIT